MSFQNPLMKNYAVKRFQSSRVSYQSTAIMAMQIIINQKVKSAPRKVSIEKKTATIVKSKEKKNS